jgi:hypothetical protein
MSGFPRIDGVPTDWVLAVAVEAYWGYALYAWLAAAPGPRSRAMAMWSCAVVFALSLVSQVSYHELTAPAGVTTGRRFVIGFASALPVIILALIAVLIHLRHLDRTEAAAAEQARQEAEREAYAAAAKTDERTALRAELAAERDALQPLRDALADAQQQAEESAEKRAILERKLAAQTTSRKRANPPRAKSASARAKQAQEKDVDARTKALDVLAAEPGISGAELGPRVGMSKRWGQLHKPELVAMAADLEE